MRIFAKRREHWKSRTFLLIIGVLGLLWIVETFWSLQQMNNGGIDVVNMNENEYDMVILFWSKVHRKDLSDSWLASSAAGVHKCNLIQKQGTKKGAKVLVTSDRRYERYTDAFVTVGHEITIYGWIPQIIRDCFNYLFYFGEPIRQRIDGNEIYILFTLESAQHYPLMQYDSVMNQFNLLMSFRGDADIYIPYLRNDSLQPLIDNKYSIPFHQKKNDTLLAWFGSNCNARNGRQIYLKELFTYIPTDSFGNCLNNHDLFPKSSRDMDRAHCGGKCMSETISQYKFYIAMENSNCKGYITEKLGIAIRASSIPIVFSINNGTLPNYDYFIPKHSYINAADFKTPFDLAQYLIKVANDEQLYNSYFAHKSGNFDSIYKLNPYRQKINGDDWCGAAQSIYDYKMKGNNRRLDGDKTCSSNNMVLGYM